MEEISAEIFELTGQKVEFDDPIVVAALFQSRLLRQGYLDGVTALEAKAAEILGNIRVYSESETEKLRIFRDSQNLAIRQSSETIRALIKAELPKLRREFYDTATEVLDEIDRSGHAKKTKFYLACVCVSIIISFVLGVLIGAGMRSDPNSFVDNPPTNVPSTRQNS